MCAHLAGKTYQNSSGTECITDFLQIFIFLKQLDKILREDCRADAVEYA